MATYKEIVGTAVSNIAGTSGVVDGQIWYDTSGEAFKSKVVFPSGVWTTGGNMTYARQKFMGAGTQTSAIVVGSADPANKAETYNGSTWSSSPNYNGTIEQNAGFGISTSAVSAGGPGTTTASQNWNGSQWTVGPSMNAGKEQFAGAGVSNTSGLVFGGNPGYKTGTESYNGSFSTEPNLNTGRFGLGGAGTITAAIAAGGGYDPGDGPGDKGMQTELYNGSWTTVNRLVTPMLSWSIAGTTTACLGMSGYDTTSDPGSWSTLTQSWNGTVWTTLSARNSIGKRYTAGCGTQGSALLVGGNNSNTGARTDTEEFTAPGTAVVTLSTS